LLALLGSSQDYHSYLKTFWKNSILKGEKTWSKALHDGIFKRPKRLNLVVKTHNINKFYRKLTRAPLPGLELNLYTKASMGCGTQPNNPWLQELPDPITRISWDNYLTISKKDADKLGLANEHTANGALNGSCVNLILNQNILEKVPVLIQPGQAQGTLGLAFGYGQKGGLKKEMQVGVNAFSLYKGFENTQYTELKKHKKTHSFAAFQLQNTLMGRGDIIKETSLKDFISKGKGEWNAKPKVSLGHQTISTDSEKVNLHETFDNTTGHLFALSIDPNKCTGCGACVASCQIENNVPVVGKSEVRRSRDMHWLRVDRYFSSESITTFHELEQPSEEPEVAFQPVMCQHCNQAPCETVCPVGATSHSRQGQNMMAYNRCVGTRYCANNCPYKVRRFNWFQYSQNKNFDYHMGNDLGRLVLNPDVTVRSRGVMEKCSLCIQKTQHSILEAKKAGRPPKDKEFETACSSVCPTGAIVFGDVNDKDSEVSKLINNPRAYKLLEHLGTKPNVVYHVKVRNKKS
jgi:Fe-S-cluster-containing dehydrogenase component